MAGTASLTNAFGTGTAANKPFSLSNHFTLVLISFLRSYACPLRRNDPLRVRDDVHNVPVGQKQAFLPKTHLPLRLQSLSRHRKAICLPR